MFVLWNYKYILPMILQYCPVYLLYKLSVLLILILLNISLMLTVAYAEEKNNNIFPLHEFQK